MNNCHFIFAGGSITNSPWLTWKDFVIERYQLSDYTLCSSRGVGNEYISSSVVNKLQSNSFACIMFTSVDKWDWVVNNKNTAELINKNEKHKVIDLTGKETLDGFWCTGSWFPVHKEYYKEHYFNLAHFLSKTLQTICLLENLFKQKNIPYLFLFDSPVLSVTEQELNQKIINGCLTDMLDHPYVKPWHDQIDWSNIYLPGLLGYCDTNNHPWHNSKMGTHPPSSSHLAFCKDHIFPVLDKHLVPINLDLDWQAKKFDKLWCIE